MTTPSTIGSFQEEPSALLPLSPPPSSRSRPRVAFRTPVFDKVEDVHMYKPGGHHPVNLGDVIRHRYRVTHKLGNGGFALVWLARDLEQDRNVALKILKADAPNREIDVLEHLKHAAGNIRITNLHEKFMIRGPNGVHQCLVLDLGGPSLDHLIFGENQFSLSFLSTAAKKLAEGLAALHAAGVCHGDLTRSNVLLEIPDLQTWTEDEIYHYLGPPKTAPLLLLDGSPAPAFAPSHVVDALDYSCLDQARFSGNVLLTDFGEAFLEDKAPKALGTPASFFAPELLFGHQPSCAVDLWALGCLIFEMHTLRMLIPTAFGSDQEAVAMAVETIGALPEAWQYFSDKKVDFLEHEEGEKHRWFDNQLERTRLLESQISAELQGLTDSQQAAFRNLLSSILVFEPSCRLSAMEVAEHSWFRLNLDSYGTPARATYPRTNGSSAQRLTR